MKLYKFEVTPLSNFITPPKGDILFGHILSYLYLKDEKKANEIKDNLVVSDMMPIGYFYRPNLPLKYFGDVDKKELRKQKWIKLENLQTTLQPQKIEFGNKDIVIKNSISRISFTTTKGFDPYAIEEVSYPKMWFFLKCKEDEFKLIKKAIKNIAEYGFGKKSSIGKGRFEFKSEEYEINKIDTKYYLTISPFLRNQNDKVWYEPYVKFGKYGLNRAKNPFKNPIILCDSGSVIKLDTPQKVYGEILENGVNDEKSYTQAKTILIPIKDLG